jgi:poly-gamma-glutamate synthesis protein (capsule biosynthesis protein)
MTFSVALSGDSIINRRVSACDDPAFRALIEQFRSADVGFTHLETLLHDYDDPEVYPAAEAGGTWMRSPPSIAEELEWAGFDLVSHASNHATDYSYGALESTWAALEEVGIDYAGTGRNLAAARGPTYRETSGGRVALVSATTSFTPWSAAGEARRDMGGRPGVNPLGTDYAAGPEYIEKIREIAAEMGLWITPDGDGEWVVNPSGLHNTTTRFIEDDVDGIRRRIDEGDRRGNLRAVAEADRQADLVIAHVHTHAWDTDGDLSDPAPFLTAFARECVDRGADIVVVQGSHAPLRGIELRDGTPIFYEPGDFFMMSDSVAALPAEFYDRYGAGPDVHPAEGMPGEALEARGISSQFGESDDSEADYGGKVENPPGGYFSGRVIGNVLPVCSFDDDLSLTGIELHPGYLRDSPALYRGVPVKASGSKARDIVEYVDDLSEPYDTDVAFEDGVGVVEL